MTQTVFHEGDRVEFTEVDVLYYKTKQILATVAKVMSGGIIAVVRDDGVTGSGENNEWMVFSYCCKLVARPAAFTGEMQQVETKAEKKGYTPDGFDANSHRDFMRNLGSAS
jgi:hypothetical protein